MSYRRRSTARPGGVIAASLFVVLGLPYFFFSMMGERPCETGTCGTTKTELAIVFGAMVAAAFLLSILINFAVSGKRRVDDWPPEDNGS